MSFFSSEERLNLCDAEYIGYTSIADTYFSVLTNTIIQQSAITQLKKKCKRKTGLSDL